MVGQQVSYPAGRGSGKAPGAPAAFADYVLLKGATGAPSLKQPPTAKKVCAAFYSADASSADAVWLTASVAG